MDARFLYLQDCRIADLMPDTIFVTFTGQHINHQSPATSFSSPPRLFRIGPSPKPYRINFNMSQQFQTVDRKRIPTSRSRLKESETPFTPKCGSLAQTMVSAFANIVYASEPALPCGVPEYLYACTAVHRPFDDCKAATRVVTPQR